MLNRVLPARFDNTYSGARLGLWLFGAVLLVKTAIALGTVFNGHAAAQRADGIPLDTFGAEATATILGLFAIWGLAQLALSAVGVLALVRYRAMVPLLFLLFLAEHVARRAVLLLQPIPRTAGAPGFTINLALLVVILLGAWLSVRPRRELAAA